MSDAIVQLLNHVLETGYEDIPEDIREMTKTHFLDTLGAIIAGSTARGCESVADLVKGFGGTPESTIAAFGGKVPASNAVWVNSTMGRSREIDDYDMITGEHASVTCVPTALALSEMLGGISGKEALAAVALGTDFIIRIRNASRKANGWTTGFYAALVSACVSAKIMKLKEEQALDALGLAFSQLSNTFQGHQEGALSVRVQHGMGARNGIISAQLASRGISGPHNILEGKCGYFPIFEQNNYDRNAMFEGLGKVYYGTRPNLKPYSCCGCTHCSIEATLQLVKEHSLKPEDIGKIIVHTNESAMKIVGTPVEAKQAPQTVETAQFSMYYTVASAVVHHEVYLDLFTPQSIRNPKVLEVAKKVSAVLDPAIEPLSGSPPSIVEIETTAGKKYSAESKYAKGHPRNPMSFEECVKKFHKSLTYSAKPITGGNKIVEMVRGIEKVSDTAEIARLLAG